MRHLIDLGQDVAVIDYSLTNSSFPANVFDRYKELFRWDYNFQSDEVKAEIDTLRGYRGAFNVELNHIVVLTPYGVNLVNDTFSHNTTIPGQLFQQITDALAELKRAWGTERPITDYPVSPASNYLF